MSKFREVRSSDSGAIHEVTLCAWHIAAEVWSDRTVLSERYKLNGMALGAFETSLALYRSTQRDIIRLKSYAPTAVIRSHR